MARTSRSLDKGCTRFVETKMEALVRSVRAGTVATRCVMASGQPALSDEQRGALSGPNMHARSGVLVGRRLYYARCFSCGEGV